MRRCLTLLALSLVLLPALATAECRASAAAWWRDANWLAAIGQCLGALFTAGAALFAYRAIEATRLAAKSQTQGQTVTTLLARYADPSMYHSLQDFGRFMGDGVDKKDRKVIADAVKKEDGDERTARERYAAMLTGDARPALDRVLSLLGYPRNHVAGSGITAEPEEEKKKRDLIAHRRAIHHHFKLVWAAGHAGVLSKEHLRLVTEANYGYELWLTAALPITIGMASPERQPTSGETSDSWDIEWPWELIEAVERAPNLEPLEP